ncbi:MAG: alpha/beta hydrolase [Kiritimatiellae bacterium]|nr:alpha/beta hydrolase [Kiritimatiellia bacterium]
MSAQLINTNGQLWKKWLIGEFTLRRLFRSLIEIFLCLLAILAWAYLFSDRIAFQAPPPTYTEGNGVYRIATPDGHRIAILALTNPAASQVVLYVHGNAEDIGGVRDIMEEYRSVGFEVYSFDYRGYGISDGKPSTVNAYEDISTVYKYLVERKGIHPDRIILHGRSLGAAIVLNLANRQPVSGVIIESAFLTAFRAISQIPLSPIDKMRNDREIQRLQCPVLFIHGEDDQTIKTWHGKKLYNLAPEPKFAYWVPNAGHDDVLVSDEAEYWKRLRSFADFVAKTIENAEQSASPLPRARVGHPEGGR